MIVLSANGCTDVQAVAISADEVCDYFTRRAAQAGTAGLGEVRAAGESTASIMPPSEPPKTSFSPARLPGDYF
ncbi:hypothetical protein [Actinomadura formosensis]|uniref:hypothetical protein n=1 Tax=Actinomadura formosensis TaxID=60706 RepID=UPI003D940ED9